MISVWRDEVGEVVPSLFERFESLVYGSYEEICFRATGDLSDEAPVRSSLGYDTVSYIVGFQFSILLSWSGRSFFLA